MNMEQSTKRKRSAPTEYTEENTLTPGKKQHIKFEEEDSDAVNTSTLSGSPATHQGDSDIHRDYDEDEDEDSDEDGAPEEITISESREQILRAEDASSKLKELYFLNNHSKLTRLYSNSLILLADEARLQNKKEEN